MSKNINIGIRIALAVVIAGFTYALYSSIMEPINFNKAKKWREDRVIERLKDIRTVQRAFKGEYGRYTGSLDSLVSFYKFGAVTVELQIGSLDDSLAVARKQVIRKKEKVAVREYLADVKTPPDSLPIVPNTGGQRFELAANTLITSSKVPVPVFECKVHYDIVLQDLDRQLVVNLNDERKKLEKYPGLKVGSLTEATNDAGNWE